MQSNLAGGALGAADWIDAQSLREASSVVSQHTAGLRELQRHLRTMLRDVSILTGSANDTGVMIQRM